MWNLVNIQILSYAYATVRGSPTDRSAARLEFKRIQVGSIKKKLPCMALYGLCMSGPGTAHSFIGRFEQDL
jgi:hypothetical protein